MTLLSSTFSVICFLFVFQSTDPIQLIPVDGGVVDRGALSSSLQVQQTGYRQDSSFEKLYRIAGSEDVYVRTSGGLHAVFRSSEYMQTKDGEIPLVPAGTVYCIGKLRPEFIAQLGVLQSPRTQETIPEMIKKDFGRIINISSIGGQWGGYNQVHYAASKAAIINLTRSVAKIYGKSGITSNAIAIGLVATDMSERELNTQAGKEKVASIPITRLGTPDEVGSLVTYLASNDAAYITGQTINLNGGMYFDS